MDNQGVQFVFHGFDAIEENVQLSEEICFILCELQITQGVDRINGELATETMLVRDALDSEEIEIIVEDIHVFIQDGVDVSASYLAEADERSEAHFVDVDLTSLLDNLPTLKSIRRKYHVKSARQP